MAPEQREEMPSTLSKDATRSASYSYHAPSPPFIYIPAPGYNDLPEQLMPSFASIDPTQLTVRDLQIITGNAAQLAEQKAEWRYEMRREAQRVLDFLYLGPASVIRDVDFLRREGITLLLVIRNAGLANTKLLSVEKARQLPDLGISAHYVDFDGTNQMVARFPEIVRLINDHLLSVYHAQAKGRSVDGQVLMPSGGHRRGKVLVACESGNDRSATVAAAYIMAVFGKGMVQAVQFMAVQRFCCTFDEHMKRILQSWEDILQARSAVAQSAQSTTESMAGHKTKRGYNDMMDEEGNDQRDTMVDIDRFTGRDPFVPFADADGSNGRMHE